MKMMNQKIPAIVLCLTICLGSAFASMYIGTSNVFTIDNREPFNIYVKHDATGNCDGTSWNDAYNYLQDALAATVDQAVGDGTIQVAAGVYKPDQGAGVTPGDRSATFQLVNGVILRGGYGGETILSGDLGKPGDNSDNSYHVVTGSGTDETTVLDGFTIIGGNADGSYPDNQGAGIYNDSSNPMVTNCTFSGNISVEGGGMYNTNSSPTVSNCTFNSNSAAPWGTYGGGMRNWNSNPILYNCTFSDNSAGSGGGGIAGGNGAIMNCTFTGNTAGNDGGGILGCNGAITNCKFIENTAGNTGGGIAGSNGAITNCKFSENSANFGGGIAGELSVVLTNCTLSCNSADSGGGMYNEFGSATLTNCILWGNTAQTGPQIYNDGTITVTYSAVEGGWDGTGNIGADPLFTGGLHLLLDSPCIDTGDNDAVPFGVTIDLDGKSRILDGDGDGRAKVDMGAYEFMNTPIGFDVLVHVADPFTGERVLTMTFEEVDQPGVSRLFKMFSGPEPPGGSMPGDPEIYYDLSTTAIYNGDIGVSIDYSETSFFGREKDLRLYHDEGGEWVDVTVLPVDSENNIIHGKVDELSLFAIFEPQIIDIDSDTLNLKSKEKWITCYIELPEGLDVTDIDVSTIMLNGQVSAQAHPTEIGDHDVDGVADLMVKFDKAAVQATVEVGDEVLIIVTGELSDGTVFEGHDIIRVID